MNDLVVWVFGIDAQEVLENANIKGFPMLVKDVSSWSLELENQSTQIDQSNLGLFFSRLDHLH